MALWVLFVIIFELQMVVKQSVKTSDTTLFLIHPVKIKDKGQKCLVYQGFYASIGNNQERRVQFFLSLFKNL